MALTAKQVEGGGAQEAQGAAGVVGLHDLTILSEAVIGDIEEAVLDLRVAAHQGQEFLGTSLLGREARHQVVDISADLPSGARENTGADLGNLRESRERRIANQLIRGPDGALLDPSMSLCTFPVGLRLQLCEEGYDIGMEAFLVFLSRNTKSRWAATMAAQRSRSAKAASPVKISGLGNC